MSPRRPPARGAEEEVGRVVGGDQSGGINIFGNDNTVTLAQAEPRSAHASDELVEATLRAEPIVPWSVAVLRPERLVSERELTDMTPSRRQYEVLLAHGARDLHITRLGLTLYNPTPTPLIVKRLWADVLSRSAAPIRARLQQPTAGALLVSVFRIELESADTTAAMILGENEIEQLNASATRGRSSIRLDGQELFDCIVEGFTKTHDVEWMLCLDVVHEGVIRTIRLGLEDKPLKTAGMPGSGPTEVWLLPGIAGPHLQRARDYEQPSQT